MAFCMGNLDSHSPVDLPSPAGVVCALQWEMIFLSLIQTQPLCSFPACVPHPSDYGKIVFWSLNH